VSTASPPASEYSSRTLRFSHVLEVVHIEAIYRLPRQDERHAAIAVAIAGLRDVVGFWRGPPTSLMKKFAQNPPLLLLQLPEGGFELLNYFRLFVSHLSWPFLSCVEADRNLTGNFLSHQATRGCSARLASLSCGPPALLRSPVRLCCRSPLAHPQPADVLPRQFLRLNVPFCGKFLQFLRFL
jgi:hypothetical protein